MTTYAWHDPFFFGATSFVSIGGMAPTVLAPTQLRRARAFNVPMVDAATFNEYMRRRALIDWQEEGDPARNVELFELLLEFGLLRAVPAVSIPAVLAAAVCFQWKRLSEDGIRASTLSDTFSYATAVLMHVLPSLRAAMAAAGAVELHHACVTMLNDQVVTGLVISFDTVMIAFDVHNVASAMPVTAGVGDLAAQAMAASLSPIGDLFVSLATPAQTS